jgi:hypothetical protein
MSRQRKSCFVRGQRFLTFAAGLVAICSCLVLVNHAEAQESSDFKRVSKGRRAVFDNCEAVEGYDRLIVSLGEVALPGKENRGIAKIRRGLRFFACTSDGSGGSVLVGKRSRSVERVVVINLRLRDFVARRGLSGCSSVSSWPAWLIYKTIGSNHFSSADPRRWTVGLIGDGAPVNPGQCVDLVDSEGGTVAKLGRYYPNGEFSFRSYSATGCGGLKGLRASEVADAARANAGKTDVYVKIAGSCYGPINPLVCKNSSSC